MTTYQGDKLKRRAYIDEPGWSPPPPEPEPLPDRCCRPLKFDKTRNAFGPTAYAPAPDPEPAAYDPAGTAYGANNPRPEGHPFDRAVAEGLAPDATPEESAA